MRGRHSTNLYAHGWSEDLLSLSVDELRRKLRVDVPAKATVRDALAYAGWLAVVAMPWLAIGAALIAWLH